MADPATDVTLSSGKMVAVSDTPGWKTWRTLLLNFLMFMAPLVVTWLAGVNWTDYLSPTHAVWIVTGVNVAMRIFTNGPVGSNVKVAIK